MFLANGDIFVVLSHISDHVKLDEQRDFTTIQLLPYCSFNVVLYIVQIICNKSGDFHSKSGYLEIFIIA